MVNVRLDNAVAAALSAKAAAQGMTLEAYLETLAAAGASVPGPRMSIEELDRLLDQEATIGNTPAGNFSRAELYSDHD